MLAFAIRSAEGLHIGFVIAVGQVFQPARPSCVRTRGPFQKRYPQISQIYADYSLALLISNLQKPAQSVDTVSFSTETKRTQTGKLWTGRLHNRFLYPRFFLCDIPVLNFPVRRSCSARQLAASNLPVTSPKPMR